MMSSWTRLRRLWMMSIIACMTFRFSIFDIAVVFPYDTEINELSFDQLSILRLNRYAKDSIVVVFKTINLSFLDDVAAIPI